MDQNPENIGHTLSEFLLNGQADEAKLYMSQLNALLTEELTSTLIDSYIVNIFNKQMGLLVFIKKASKTFKEAVATAFEIVYTIVNNFPEKIKQYIEDIIDVSLAQTTSSAPVVIKDKALILIILIIESPKIYCENCEKVYKTLLGCFNNRLDKSSTVQEKITKALGVFAKKYSNLISDKTILCKMFMSLLEGKLAKHSNVMSATFSAFSDYLDAFYNFDDKNICGKLLIFIKQMVVPNSAYNHVPRRAAVLLWSKHISLFSDELYSSYKWWHIELNKWLKDANVDNKKVANVALTAFYGEIAKQLESKEGNEHKEILLYFIEHFKQTTSNPIVENFEMRLAISGYGIFAEACTRHLTKEEITKMFVTILQEIEHTYVVDAELNSEQMDNLPFYIQTFTRLMKQLTSITNYHLQCLQNFIILMIKLFSKFSQLYHSCIIEAFVMTASYLLSTENPALEDFYNIVVYQGVIWTCSHPMIVDAELIKEQNLDIITYKNYLPFWIGIFNILDSDKINLNYDDRLVLKTKIFDELMKTLFLLINKLNLNVKVKDDIPVCTDPETSLVAVKVNDIVIFVNVVDFYKDIFQNIHVNMCKKWINMYMNHLVVKSLKYPLVSGFYKLIASGLKVCDVLNYFDEKRLVREEVNISFKSLQNFIENLLWKMKQYKGDLQMSCFQILLTVPVCLIENLLPACAPAFISLFSMSKSNYILVEMALNALERWFYYLPPETSRPFLDQVVPFLDTFLRSKSLGGQAQSKSVVKTRKTKQVLKKRKVLVEAESELFKLQKSIVTFIGQLDRSLCYTFVNTTENVKPIIWAQNQHLKVVLEFGDVNLDLYLEIFMPRIIELALNCSDRKTRITACESLHACVIFLLGISREMDESDLDGLIQKLAFTLLHLGCDIDPAVHNLFNPLLLQLMHYYSKKKDSSHCGIFIDALMDGITHPTDSAIRDLSGKCIKEFIHWTIKQSTKSQLETDPINIKIIINKIISFSQHPDPNVRLGAALIFNNIYTELREEESILNLFWLELLHAFIVNISFVRYENYEDSNCLIQVSEALKHLERVFVEKSHLFNMNNKKRRIPPNFVGSQLKDVALFLLDNTGSINLFCREKCIQMFCKFAPLVSNCQSSLTEFIKKHVDEDDWVLKTYEFKLMQIPTLKDMKHCDSTDSLFMWCDYLLCALDGYIFVIENKLIESKYLTSKSKLFISIKYFLENMQSYDLKFNVVVMEKEFFSSYKIRIINKIIKFASALLKSNEYLLETPEIFLGVGLWNLIVNILFEPIKLGFDLSFDLPSQHKIVINFVNLLEEKCEVKKSELVMFILNHVQKHIKPIDLKITTVSLNQRLLVKGMLLLETSSLSKSLNLKQHGIGVTKKLFTELLDSNNGGNFGKNLEEYTFNQYCSTYLQLASLNEEELPVMIECLYDRTEVKFCDTYSDYTCGMYFFEKFCDIIANCFTSKLAHCFDIIFTTNKSLEQTVVYLLKILKYVHQEKDQFDDDKIRHIVDCFLKQWKNMVPFLNMKSTNILSGLELLSKLAYISPDPVYTLSLREKSLEDWIVDLLSYSEKEWSEENAINFKIQVIHILPCIAGPRLKENIKLKNGLQLLKTKHYIKSSTTSEISKIILFDKLADVLAASKSITILEPVIEIYATGLYNLKTESLVQYIKYPDFNFQMKSIQIVYNFSLKSEYIEGCRLGTNILSVLLENCSYRVCEKFFEENIQSINRSIKCPVRKENMVQKTILFILVEVFFLRIKFEDLEKDSNQIAKTAFPKSENPAKDLLKFLTGSIVVTSKETVPDNSNETKEHFRLYQCHSYKALASIISNTKKDIEFYSFLFKENSWDKLIDLEKKYQFQLDFDAVPAQKKVLVKIRNKLKEKRCKQGSLVESAKYMQSQHLFDSTLSEDVSKFDFTSTIIRNQLKQEEYSLDNKEDAIEQSEIVLEAVDINNHECMPTLCGLIQHMVENNIHIVPKDDVLALPNWMEAIQKVLLKNDAHVNVKVFLVKVIENNSDVFKPYIKWFFGPIVKFIVDGHCGVSINFFISDLITMLTSWSDATFIIEEVYKQPLFDLFEFLIKNAYHERQDIFKYNLELIKLTVEAWKQFLQVPYDLVRQTIIETANNKKLCLGIHIVAIVLANKIEPWTSLDIDDFIKLFCKILDNTERSVYQPCSEAIGMILTYLKSKDYLETHYLNTTMLIKMYLNKMQDDKFTYCLEGISKYDSQIVDDYVYKLLPKLRMSKGNFKSIYLRIFLSRIDHICTINDFYFLEFNHLLKDPNVDIQFLTLKIIQNCTQHFPIKDLLGILEIFKTFVKHPNSKCRGVMYEVLMSLCSRSDDKKYVEVYYMSADILLYGLVDEDCEIQDKIYEYYTNKNNLPKEIVQRFITMLHSLYKPDLEDTFLGYSTYILLDLLKDTAQFHKKLFKCPLYKCSFLDYDIKSMCHWRAQHATLIPMFTDTYRSFESAQELFSVMDPSFLRATLTTFSFTPTQTTQAKGPESVYSDVNSSFLLSFNEQSSSVSEFKNPNNVAMSNKYRRRFMKNQWKISKHFATREVTKLKKMHEERKESVIKREHSATVYRKYRKGDFPDIDIELFDLIKPLQMLSKEDLEIGRIMYTSLANSVINHIKTKSFSIENIRSNINNIFNKSTRFIPNVMSAFLDIALAQKDVMKFQPDTICNVCQSGGLLSVGTLLLEEYLISNESTISDTKKHRSDEDDNLHWVKLAELYREMDEWDTVKAIFLEKMNCNVEYMLNAINSESNGDWKTAKDYYRLLIEEDSSFHRKDFYYESYFKCFANVSEWEDLSTAIKIVADCENENTILEEIWDQDWKQKNLLPWFITSQVRIVLEEKSKLRSLLCNINNILKDPEKSEYIKENFPEELAVLSLLDNNNDFAKQYLQTYISSFLDTWGNINPLFSKVRFNKLLNLRSVVDINTFISKFDDLFIHNYESVIKFIMKYWNQTSCDSLHNLVLNETRTLYRQEFLTLLNKKLSTILDDDDDKIIFDELKNMRQNLSNSFIDVALKQNNYYVARKYVRKTQSKSEYFVSKLGLLKEAISTDPHDKLQSLVIAWETINPFLKKADNSDSFNLSVNLHFFDITQKLSVLCASTNLLESAAASIAEFSNVNITNWEDIKVVGADYLQHAIECCQEKNKPELDENLANAYIKLAYFSQNKTELEKNFIYYVLKAMNLSSLEGIQLFPIILNMNSLGNENKDVFMKEVKDIPTWMFLGWIPQLLANLSTEKVFAISEIILRIAKEYPQAIMYAYRLSKEKYSLKNDEIGLKAQQVLERLDALLLEGNIFDDFLKALSHVVVPQIILKYHIGKLIRACEQNSKEKFDVAYKKLEELFTATRRECKNKFRGKVFDDKITAYKKDLDKIKNKKFNSKIIIELKSLMEKLNTDNKFSVELIDYCPWLHYFHIYNSDANLEIPGQYDGQKRPMVQYHVKIAGFGELVSVQNSLKKPIKLTFLGNNGKEYPFLIKYGEDLRQDQRIEQLFALMNNIFKSDAMCSHQNLNVFTYQVIPLTGQLGLIQWVEDCKELFSFIKESGFKNEKEADIIFKKILIDYNSWISSVKSSKNDCKYATVCRDVNREKTISKYLELVNKVPWDILRMAFCNISLNVESFVALRYNFVKSYSTMCIAHWILGIGDRHLGNSMLSFKKGEVVGIDFGHSFGTGTQFLQVPELVPFRLTPHILNLMQPLYEYGLFKETMVHTLRALRKNSKSLLATMKVFIEDPSVDWLEHAMRSQNIESGTSIEWYPMQKITQAQRKLEGSNSTTIMVEELKAGHSNRPQYLDSYILLVEGKEEFDVRARKEKEGLSVEEQVACLIDHATDYNLLGRMWQGWQAWI